MSGTVGFFETILMLVTDTTGATVGGGSELSYVGKWITALLPTVAIGATGWMTFKVSRDQKELQRKALHNHQFDRKLKVYFVFLDFLNEFPVEGYSTYERIANLQRETIETRFLFGDDIVEFRKDLLQNSSMLRHYKGVLKSYHDFAEKKGDEEFEFKEKYEEVQEKVDNLMKWFNEQYNYINALFGKYLEIKR